MKNLLLLSALLAPFGCARAEIPPAVAPVQKPVDAWTARRALYDIDATQPLDVKLKKSEDGVAAKTTKLSFRGARGDVPAYFVLPHGASAAKPLPALVLLHGKDGRVEDMMPLAQLLASRGYASVLPEVVGHGERKNGVPLFNPDAKTMRAGFIESVQDIQRGISFLAARPEVDANRIGLLGISMGAIQGTMAAATDERIATAILVVGGGDWKTISEQSQENFARARKQIGPLKPEEIALLDDIDPKNFAAHISPRPVLMLNGRTDKIVPPDSAKILFEAAREPKKQIWFDSGHFIPPAEAAIPIAQWLDTHLKNRAQTPVAASLTQ